jgi:hypothetical protein
MLINSAGCESVALGFVVGDGERMVDTACEHVLLFLDTHL